MSNTAEMLEQIHAAYKTCTWGNTKETPEDWLHILQNGSDTEKQRLFSILFREDPVEPHILALFTKSQISQYLADMSRKEKRPWVEKRRKVWRYLYCGIREPIPELDWPIRAETQKDREKQKVQTIQAIIKENGDIILEEPITLKHPHKAIVTILEEVQEDDSALMAETSLKEDWLRPEEDAAWASLP